MQRRQFLAAAGATTVLPGCTGVLTGTGPTGGRHELGEYGKGRMADDPDAYWQVAVAGTTAQPSAYSNAGRASESLVAASNGQFLFAALDARLPENYVGGYSVPADLPGTFTAVVDGTEYPALGEPVRPGGEAGAFGGHVFDVDASGGVEDAHVDWTVGELTHTWPLTDGAREQLRRRPEASAVGLDAPAEATDGEEIPVTVTASNAGDAGAIRVGLFTENNRDVRLLAADVAAGGSREWTETFTGRASAAGAHETVFHAVTAAGGRTSAGTVVFQE